MERYRAVFDACPDGILLVDAQGVIRDVNPQAVTLFGYDREELLGSLVERLVPKGARTGHDGHRHRYAVSPNPRPMGIGMELEGERKDGSLVPLEISLSPLDQDGESWTIAMVRDVGEHRRLRLFGRGALKAAEDERRRISRELHDNTAQALAGLMLRLTVLERSESPGRQQELLGEMHEAVEEAIEGVRRISRGLRPPALEDAGVVAAIHAHVRELSVSDQLEVEVEADAVDEGLDSEGRLVLYRVVQESLTNVVRHAGARKVHVRVKRAGNRVVTEIADDGRGFQVENPPGRGDSLGLMGMRERAASVRGALTVVSTPGRGTTVHLSLPFRLQEA